MRNAKATSMGLSDPVNVLKKPAASDTTQVTSEVIPRVKRGGPKVQDDGVIDVEDTKSVQQGDEVEAEESEEKTDPRSEDEDEEANKTEDEVDDEEETQVCTSKVEKRPSDSSSTSS